MASLALILLAAVPSQAAAPVTSAGQLYGFGENAYGELGSAINSGTGVPNPAPLPADLPAAAGPVAQVAVGAVHSLVLTASGQLYAFGDNFDGQLGNTTNNGTNNPNAAPTLVSLPGAAAAITQIAAGDGDSFALTSAGEVYAFGDNGLGQLGIPQSGTPGVNPTPALVSLPGATGPAVQIACGGLHTLVRTSTGQLYAFGYNQYGQLGITANFGTNTANPAPTLVGLPGATGVVTTIGAGSDDSFAVTSTGQLFAFGEDGVGQLGLPASATYGTPTLVSLPGATGTVTQIASGVAHTLVLTSTGQLYAFGLNNEGQLGTSVNSGANTANSTPIPITLPGATAPIIRIATGYDHSLVLTATGQLYTFGFNEDGELGRPDNSGTSTPNPTPTAADLGGATFETMAQGVNPDHSLAVISDLAVAGGALPAGQVGTAYSAGAQASGGVAPYSWAASGLAAGLTIDSQSGQITGTPSAVTTASVVLTVTDVDGITASATLPLAVSGAPSTITTTTTAVSAARLKASLLAQLAPKGKAAKIGALVKKKSFAFSFKALRAGGLVIDWYYLPKGARLAGTKIKPVLVAQGRRTFAGARTLTVTIKLTAKGRRLLLKAKRLRITAKGIFSLKGAGTISALETTTLTR